MRVAPDHRVRPHVDRPPAKAHLVDHGVMLLLIAPVKVREDDVGGPTCGFDGTLQRRDR